MKQVKTTTPNPNAWMHFFKVGIQYYIAGRAAARMQQIPVTGNLLHHAVEMLLKGEMSKSLPLEELKTKYGHLLIKTWVAFKALHPKEDLSGFDELIKDLERFEKIRYPDEYVLHGAAMALGWGTFKPMAKTLVGPQVPEYFLYVNEVDDLVAQLFIVCRINPPAYLGARHPEADSALKYQNAKYADWGLS